MSDKDGSNSVVVQYEAIWIQSDKGLQLVSLKDTPAGLPSTPNEALQSIAWIVGDWVNEGSDGRVTIQYQWSEDGNFILGQFNVKNQGATVLQSSVRLGWDSVQQKIRSWTFDSDGGFGESLWNTTPNAWVIRSNAVSPTGETGSATVTLKPISNDRILLKGANRLSGNSWKKIMK